MVDSNEELKKITASVCKLAASIHGSVKASTTLRNDVAKANRHSIVRAKARSIIWQWVGEDRAMAAHIKLKDYFSKLIDDGVTILGNRQETIERSFIEKAQKHIRYLEQIKKFQTYAAPQTTYPQDSGRTWFINVKC